jgi:UrcA family protein
METRRNLRGIAYRAGAWLLFAGATAGAVAEEAVMPGTVTQARTVQYRASHAETAGGAEELYRKLERAAAKVCKVPGRRVEGASYSACAGNALAAAVKDVDIDAVAAVYVERNKLADRQGTVTVARR